MARPNVFDDPVVAVVKQSGSEGITADEIWTQLPSDVTGAYEFRGLANSLLRLVTQGKLARRFEYYTPPERDFPVRRYRYWFPNMLPIKFYKDEYVQSGT
jgi:hypothetical protein